MAFEWTPPVRFFRASPITTIRPCGQPGQNWIPFEGEVDLVCEWDPAGHLKVFSGSWRSLEIVTQGGTVPVTAPRLHEPAWVFSPG